MDRVIAEGMNKKGMESGEFKKKLKEVNAIPYVELQSSHWHGYAGNSKFACIGGSPACTKTESKHGNGYEHW